MTARIAILVFDDFDLIDAGGPYEVFLTASRLSERDGNGSLYEVVMVSPSGADVTAYGGMALTGLASPADVGAVDLVIVPGTIDVSSALASEDLNRAVSTLTGAAPLVASVCTGAFLLARAGLLDGKQATTHWEDVADLGAVPGVGAVTDLRRWVDAGEVVTSGGLTSGMHMSLHLVARAHGVEMAARTARQLDLEWDPSGQRPAGLIRP